MFKKVAKYRIVGIVICLIALFFFIAKDRALSNIYAMETISSCILYPFLKLQQMCVEPFQNRLRQRFTINKLQHNYTSLQKNYEELLAENIALKAMHYYTEEIGELSYFKKRYCHTTAYIGQVLTRHLSEHSQFFLINGGSRQGIMKDMVAIYKNCLIGKVVEVYPWYCKVCLITDMDCNVSALCVQTKITGILQGLNNTENMQLHYVSHLKDVLEKDMIISSGDGLIFPQGFGLGKIVVMQKGDLFYTIHVKPLLDFYSLHYCILLAKNEIENSCIE